MSAPATESSTAASSSAVTGSASDLGHSSSGAAAEQSGPPRAVRDGSNPAAAVSDGSAADGPPPAVRLHRHALESIFAFLHLSELAAALRVSRDWLVAVQSMRRMEMTFCSNPYVPLRAVARSAMSRHVGCLQSALLNAATLSALADAMGHLRTLTGEIHLPPIDQPVSFPAALRRLDINFSPPADSGSVNAAIAAIGRLPRLDRLDVVFFRIDPLASFAPLAALPRLRHFSLNWHRSRRPLSDAQVDELRALPRLQKIDVDMRPALLHRLLRQPHDLQWQRISLPWPLDDEAAALLPQLPSLTEINAMAGCKHFDWLRGLPNLTDVDFEFSRAEGAGYENRAASLVAGLQSCANIEILSLEECAGLTSAHLAELLPRLPRLRELTLSGLSIDSLAFLAQPPMTDQLTTLSLENCEQLPLVELRHVHSLRGLQELHLYRSFTARMDDHSQSLYEPPSLLLPRLELFDYIAR